MSSDEEEIVANPNDNPNADVLGLNSDDENGSVAGSDAAPPANPRGQNFQSSALRQSALWGRNPPPQVRSGRGGAGGRGRGRGSGASVSGEPGDGPRYERLSSLMMEPEFRQTAEGGASTLFSEDDGYQNDVLGKRGKKSSKSSKKKRPLQRDDDSVCAESEVDGQDGVERALDSDEEEGEADASSRKRGKRPAKHSSSAETKDARSDAVAAALAAAAFGGSRAAGNGSDSDSDESESQFSQMSAEKRAAEKAAFPIRGITCVGCALPHRIGPVESFVVNNICRMSEEAVWKHAALVYKLEIQDKAKKEGGIAPGWSYKDIRSHYTLHSTNPIIARQTSILQLQLMRETISNRLVRNEDGVRELDKANADLYLKVLKSESTERGLLANLLSGVAGGSASGGGGKGGKAGGGPTVGDAK